ncbi:MAG: aminotransferase class V-fold PLP-dependent enzyme [Phycisphaerales bacterium]
MKSLPKPSPLFERWALDPSVVYLNHGSFGACPRDVLAHQSELRAEMEREGVRWFVERVDDLLDESRATLATLIHARPADLVFVPNATHGVATALAALEPSLSPGDEILVTSHEYPGCMTNVRRTAARTGTNVITAPLVFPSAGPDEVVAVVLGAATSRTRVALISHITAPSALVLPLARIVPDLERRGIAVIVDGAHAAGQVRGLNVPTLGASFYTSNCHKWICSPKGSAFLHAREDRHAALRPLCLSNFADQPKHGRSRLHSDFDYVGTGDFTAYVAIGRAIDAMASIVGEEVGTSRHAGVEQWDEITRRNHDLVVVARQRLCAALGIEPPAPDSMLGSMATLLLPTDPAHAARLAARPTRYHDALQDALVDRHKIQVPVWSVTGDPRRLFRISAQLYNSVEQYDYLAGALREELDRERSL